MSKQVYFVIAVDLDTKEAFIDDGTFEMRFGKDEQVWDTETDDWTEDEDLVLYNEALAILNSKPLAKDGN